MLTQSVTVLAEGSGLTALIDPAALLPALGGWLPAAVGAMVFIESGALFPFLPGDSLVFTAGLLHGKLGIPLTALLAIVIGAAVLGDQTGYWLGRRYGRAMFRADGRILKTRYLRRSEAFFARHGGKALVLARFVPIVRTFVPLAAGAAEYTYRRFLLWNVSGALMWGAGLTLAGSLLGGVGFIRENVDLLAILIVAASLVPVAAGFLHRRHAAGRDDAGADAAPAGPATAGQERAVSSGTCVPGHGEP
jgi:membrane-associated protein